MMVKTDKFEASIVKMSMHSGHAPLTPCGHLKEFLLRRLSLVRNRKAINMMHLKWSLTHDEHPFGGNIHYMSYAAVVITIQKLKIVYKLPPFEYSPFASVMA